MIEDIDLMSDSKPTEHKERFSKERQLLGIRRVSLLIFYMLLVGGVAMIGIGAATHLIQFMVDGGVILVVSPIFFVMNQFAKRKMKELGID